MGRRGSERPAGRALPRPAGLDPAGHLMFNATLKNILRCCSYNYCNSFDDENRCHYDFCLYYDYSPGGDGGAEPPGAIVTRGRFGGPVLMAGIYVSRTDSYDVTYRNRVRLVCNRVRLVCNLRVWPWRIRTFSPPVYAAGVGRAGSAGATASEPPTLPGFVKLADELVLCEAAPIASGGASPAPCGASPASCGASQARTPS
jgi:hypothetical protein